VCQPYWVDVSVPRGAEAGKYSAKIGIKSDEFAAGVELTLNVWDFSLPEQPSLKTMVGSLYYVSENHGVARGSPKSRMLKERYRRLLKDHRLDSTRVPPVPIDAATGRAQVSADYLQQMKAFVLKHRPQIIRIPMTMRWPYKDPFGKDSEKLALYLTGIDRMLATNPWIPPAFVYMIDEPHSAEAYHHARTLGRMLDDAGGRLMLMIHEEPPVDPSWGSIEAEVDIWVLKQKAWPADKAKERQAKGKQVWSYSGLASRDRPVPVWQLDAPLLNYMVPFWTTWSLGLDGFFHWGSVFASGSEDVWVDPITLVRGNVVFNGEGCLIYPGLPAGIDGPVSTIRLKVVRDAMDCYDYFRILSDLGGREDVDRITHQISPTFFQWEKNYRNYLDARRQLASAILDRIAGKTSGGIKNTPRN
jgi:hypothetical protein